VLTVGSDSGVLGDNLTKVATPTLSGTGEPLSTITIYDGSTVLGRCRWHVDLHLNRVGRWRP
jgi:hypothetical protein